ncbi:MAG: CBS domain-containing protein [Rubrivivax sp.]|nr:CBS domain-containing protein [Rubrivivax sp.]
MLSLVTARVRDAYVRKPFYVEGATHLVEVCRQLAAHRSNHALVRDRAADGGERLGIFTTTDLRDALLREVPPAQLAVRDVARFDLVSVEADAELFEALWLMVSRRVHRLVVKDGGAVVGVLGQLDLVSFVANHSHIIGVQVDEAETVAELKAAAARVDEMVRLLHGSGIRIERVARLVSELNTRIFARLWALLAPAELVAHSCLLAMGSEGRGEQILKTDQDNALIVRDGFEMPGLAEVARRFNAALVELGWPPCPGDIMLTNPRWCQPLTTLRETMRGWIYGQGPEAKDGPMHLAIFFDAVAVAGDATLLDEARAQLDRILSGADTFLARFAAAADQFQEPGGWFTRLTSVLGGGRDEQPLDLKKLGTFPIVHGVRALSLQYGVRAQSTAERLRALVAAGRLEEAQARDLLEALRLLMGVRVTHQLAQRARGEAAGNEVRPSDLSTLEREPLRDALAIVKRFRLFLRQHFRFDTL